MIGQTAPTLLLLGIARRPHWSGTSSFYTATTLGEAIATIRLVNFDLLVIGTDDASVDIWGFLDRILGAWPSQAWIMASEQITTADEVRARSLGALMVLHTLPEDTWLVNFAASLREREMSKTARPLTTVAAKRTMPNDGLAPAKTS